MLIVEVLPELLFFKRLDLRFNPLMKIGDLDDKEGVLALVELMKNNKTICHVETTKLPENLGALISHSCMVNRCLSRKQVDRNPFFTYCSDRINNHPKFPPPPIR